MTLKHRRTAVALAAGLCCALLGGYVHAKPASKWRIELNHVTQNDGTLVLRIAPEGGAPIEVQTKVPANTSENRVADMLRDSLRASLGEGYHVETDDGEDVIVKRRGKTPKFELTMVSTSLTGLEIRLRRS